MNLPDEGRDESRRTGLIERLLDGTLTEEERFELQRLLKADEAQADRFVGLMAIHSLLRQELSDYRPPTLFESLFGATPEVPSGGAKPESQRTSAHDARVLGSLWGGFRAAMSSPLVASVVTCGLMLGGLVTVLAFIPAAAAPLASGTFATISATEDCTWLSGNLPTYESAKLSRGVLRLRKGNVELAFASGARVILHGPVDFELVSAERCFLHVGQAVSHVPPEAAGFTVGTPVAEMVGFGAEFGVHVDEDRQTFVHCFQGQVDVKPNRLLAPTANSHDLVAGGSIAVVCDGSPAPQVAFAPDQFVRGLETTAPPSDVKPTGRDFEVVNVELGPGDNPVFTGPGAMHVNSGEYWNSITELGRESVPLLTASRRPTTVTITVDGQLMFSTSYSHSGNALQDDYCFVRDPGAAGRFFIRGLVPNAKYNLCLFGTAGISTAKADQVAYGAPEGSVFTIGDESKATAGLRPGDSPFSPGKDHVTFWQVKAGSAGEIRGTWTNNAQANSPFNTNPFGPFNGLQIVGPLSTAEEH